MEGLFYNLIPNKKGTDQPGKSQNYPFLYSYIENYNTVEAPIYKGLVYFPHRCDTDFYPFLAPKNQKPSVYKGFRVLISKNTGLDQFFTLFRTRSVN